MTVDDIIAKAKETTGPIYNIGDEVFLKTDNDQLERIVIAICIRETGVSYELACGMHSSWHYGMELSINKDVKKSTSN
jgi:hypothetical protein